MLSGSWLSVDTVQNNFKRLEQACHLQSILQLVSYNVCIDKYCAVVPYMDTILIFITVKGLNPGESMLWFE